MPEITLALNRYAFHWSFPEMVAEETGLFSEQGVKVMWRDVTPSKVVSKSALYTDLITQGGTDIYHAGEWACINRVLKAPGTRLVAKSPPAEGTLNRSFALFVREDSGVYTPSDLAGRAVAIEEGTGAQYTAMVDLEAHVPLEKIRLVQVGEPHRRLKALIGGEVESASLVGPWSDIGKALGLRMVLKTKRLNPTTIVVREDAETGLLRRFFKAVNNAIDLMNEHPARFQESYFQRVKSIVDEMSLGAPLEALRRAVVVPRWSKWEAYTEHDFERAYAWMVDRNLAPPGHVPGEVVGTNNQDLFS